MSRISSVLAQLSWSQADFAEVFRVSQKQVSIWNKMEFQCLPDRVASFLDVIQFRDGEQQPVFDENFSYTPEVFSQLWEASGRRKRIAALDLTATVRPSVSSEGFADVLMEVGFRGVRCVDRETIYMDCVGIAPEFEIDTTAGTISADTSQASVLKENQDGSVISVDARGTRVTNDSSIQHTVGPHAIGYEIHETRGRWPVSVSFEMIRGAKFGTPDGAGVPVYHDVAVGSVAIKLVLANCCFDDHKAASHLDEDPYSDFYLLRRTKTQSRPQGVGGELRLPIKRSSKVVGDETWQVYESSPLMFPRSELGYCIAWQNLMPSV